MPAHDFSTNSNACGPCPAALSALRQADATRYPDPAYTALRAALAALHGVTPDRIVVAGSASEFIHRITTWARLHGCTQVQLPPHSYGDYAQAAQAHGLAVLRRSAKAAVGGEGSDAATPATLHWACEPASPLGTVDGVLSAWHGPTPPGSVRVLDCAYRPLPGGVGPCHADSTPSTVPSGLAGSQAHCKVADLPTPSPPTAALALRRNTASPWA